MQSRFQKRSTLHITCAQRYRDSKPYVPAIKPKKSYGQNFLIDEQLCSKIAGEAALKPGDRVLEIGPGTGALTAELLRLGAQVVAVEADWSLAKLLKETFKQEIAEGRLQLEQGDATRINLREILQSRACSATLGCRVIANLPFNITTEMLKILLPMGDLFSDLHVMLQLEAAERLSGSVRGNSAYRVMSVLVEFYSTAKMGQIISRTAFNPQPNVDCAMVRFNLKDANNRVPVPSEQAFKQLVNVCFSSRRKLVRNNLRAVFSVEAVEAAMEKHHLQDDVRPQELRMEDFAALARELYCEQQP